MPRSATLRALSPQRVFPSTTVGLLDAVARMRAEGRRVFDLSSGDPDFDTPNHIIEAGVSSLRSGRTHYAPSRGVPELAEAIAAFREGRTGIRVDPSREVIVTPSAKYALATAISSIVGLGEKVMILSPSWISYASMVRIAGAEPYFVALDAASGYVVTADVLEAGLQPGTRMIIINSPNNPTGRMFDNEELDVLADFVQKRDLVVLSDEIYEDISFGKSAVSLAGVRQVADRVVVVSGFSKAFAMTGWRLGYIVASPPLADRILAVHQHSATCTATFVQDAGVAALTGSMEPVARMVAEYKARVDAAVPAFNRIPGVKAVKPDGTFYLLVDISGTPKPEASAFSTWVLEGAGVSTVPGSSFGLGAEQSVRVALTSSLDQILESISRLGDFVSR